MKQWIVWFMVSAMVIMMGGCGAVPDKVGYLIDSPVANIDYECGTKKDKTNNEGKFECSQLPVTFSVGGIEVGTLDSIPLDGKVYPQDLAQVGWDNFIDDDVIKIAVFLQSLDDDGNIATEITLPTEINSTQSAKLSEMTLDEIRAFLTSIGKTPVSQEDAIKHLKEQFNIDVTKPIITLNGASIITLTKGTAYTELGATATDDRDGTVTVTISGSVDVNTVGSYTITYKAKDDAGNEATATRTVNVTEEVVVVDTQAPVFTSLATATVVENQTTAITLVATDADSVTITYSIGGGDSAGFNISGGVVTFKVAPDYETKNSYNFVATASDGVHETTQNVTITVSNVADVVPTLTAFSGSIAEDATIGTSVGTVAVGSAGDSAITTYTLSDTSNFEISTAGVITTKTTLDYETTASYALTVTATNGAGVSSAVAVTITVNNVADVVPTLTAFNGSVAEDVSIGTSVGTVAVASAGDSAITAYTLSDTTNFEISTAGAITTKTMLDYETTASYALTVTATNGAGVSSAVAVNITVSDVTEAIAPKKTGQTISYDASGNEVADGTQRDDGYYQTGTTPSYTRDNTNETVTDNVTGLMWQDDDAVSSVTKPWVTQANYDTENYSDTTGDTATTYCNELVMAGYEDWRLPTSSELLAIVDNGRVNPAIDPKFVNTTSDYYWSATSLAGYTDYAWIVYFYDGHTDGYNKNYSNYVRCVRAGQ